MNRFELRRERNKRILDCAEQLVSQKGLYSLSLPELAKLAACPVNTLYSHFPNREDVAISLFDRWVSRWYLHSIQLLSQSPAGFVERLLAMMLCAASVHQNEMHQSGVAFVGSNPKVWDNASHDKNAVTRRIMKMSNNKIVEFVKKGRQLGYFHGDNEQIDRMLRKMYVLERGYCVLSNNKAFRDAVVEAPLKDLFEDLLDCFPILDWKIDIENINFCTVIDLIDSVMPELLAFDVDQFICQLSNES
ncbi:TetR/AcrR family transcriptional regulator [Ferrimonas lipolytica]|uniref:TetR/AcrR family transcriptional regulator n=1 Tax=Ferrimonas lipolytica TaxID=2724191 RepID=A0A6H1UHQ6_9GAMM|nr:TetR/AcrR family transcriptional regulator [Ferrimonas lipolytica]QIZ78140.1 TetR/AcrR family transcriptional regulator [Ferrimonas lipolytica]